MKSLVFIWAIASTLVAAVPVDSTPPKPEINKETVPGLKIVPKPLYDKLFDVNGKLQSVFSNPPTATLPKSTVPEVQIEKSKDFEGTIRKKIRYGPYRLPPISEENWQKKAMNLAGMADEYHHDIKKPCDECMIASLSANLEYADGSPVPAANAWLHHSAVIMQGPKVKDPICGESNTETLFSSGNERSTTRYYPGASSPIQAGYHVRPEDTLTSVGEYKSEIDKEQWVWLTLTYEIFDGPRPTWRDSHVVWMSTIGSLNCAKFVDAKNPFGSSNLTSSGVPKALKFSEHSMPWNSPINGIILGMGGHLHDGGESVEFYQNGKRLCESKATYSSAPGVASMGSHHAGGEHVNGMTGCKLGVPVKENDQFWLTANYDFSKHEGSKTESGELDEVMGVGVVLLVT